MKEPVFIVGCDRSGTTLLRLILNGHPSLHIPSESGFLPHLRKHKSIYGDFTQAHQRWFFIRDLQTHQATSKGHAFSIFKLTVEEAEIALCNAAPLSYVEAAATLFSAAAQKQGKHSWGDKTPKYTLYIPWLAEAFPDAKFVHIIRDGRDVASSMIKIGWHASFLQAAKHWQERVSAGISAGRALGDQRYYELHYEQLITDPEKSVQAVCSWLGLAFLPEMLAQHQTASEHVSDWQGHDMVKKSIDPSKVSSWKEQLSSQQIADFESVTGELLSHLGYETSGVKVFWGLRAARSAMVLLQRFSLKANKVIKDWP